MEYKTIYGTIGGLHEAYINFKSFADLVIGDQLSKLGKEGWIVKSFTIV